MVEVKMDKKFITLLMGMGSEDVNKNGGFEKALRLILRVMDRGMKLKDLKESIRFVLELKDKD